MPTTNQLALTRSIKRHGGGATTRLSASEGLSCMALGVCDLRRSATFPCPRVRQFPDRSWDPYRTDTFETCLVQQRTRSRIGSVCETNGQVNKTRSTDTEPKVRFFRSKLISR